MLFFLTGATCLIPSAARFQQACILCLLKSPNAANQFIYTSSASRDCWKKGSKKIVRAEGVSVCRKAVFCRHGKMVTNVANSAVIAWQDQAWDQVPPNPSWVGSAPPAEALGGFWRVKSRLSTHRVDYPTPENTQAALSGLNGCLVLFLSF